jgi:hypothetical protein
MTPHPIPSHPIPAHGRSTSHPIPAHDRPTRSVRLAPLQLPPAPSHHPPTPLYPSATAQPPPSHRPASAQPPPSPHVCVLGATTQVLAAVSGAPTWDAFNQGSIFDVLPPERRALYDRLIFGVHGAPSDHGAVHGYDRTSYNGANGTAPGHDVWKVAGVYGGWTASDVTASTADVARFGYDLYGSAPPQLLSNASKAIMVPQYNPHSHFPYGFATVRASLSRKEATIRPARSL